MIYERSVHPDRASLNVLVNIVYQFYYCVSLVKSFLVHGPVDTTASVGDTIQLKCNSNLSTTVKWILGHPGTVNARTIFEATSDMKGYIYTHFAERFSCVRQQNGDQNLVIKSVNYSDSGSYTCIDDEGFGYIPGASNTGRWYSAILNVTAAQRLSDEHANDTVSSIQIIDESRNVPIMQVIVPTVVVCFLVIFVIVLLLLLLNILQQRNNPSAAVLPVVQKEQLDLLEEPVIQESMVGVNHADVLNA